MGKKVLTTLVLVGAMLALPATAAFAHDCFIVNRSTQGAIGSGHSSTNTDFAHGWVTFSIADTFAQTGVSDVDAAMTDWLALGYPSVFSSRVDKLLGDGTGAETNGIYANGKGLEHFSESPVLQDLVGIILKYGGDPALLDG